MKTRLFFTALLGLSLFLAACKEDSNPVDQGSGGDTGNFFPGNTGTYYKFVVETQDSTGSAVPGSRSVRYTGTSTFGGKQYTQETDTIFFGPGIPDVSVSYFRKANDGIFYYLDTTGLGEVIPDSLAQYIAFNSELKAFNLPLQEGSSWNVFKMTLTYLVIVLDLVDVSANVTGKENVVLNLASGQVTKEALKVKFVLKLTFPDPENPFATISQSYNAFCWVVKDIGVVKWEGNATVFGAFAGSGIDFGDTTRTASQSLVDYDIK